jgi:predicted transcriptional regulator
MGAVNIIELLARSEHRVRILDLLCEHGSLEKHALGEQLDASRTTIGRNLDALEEQGWIRRTNSHCSITRQGELVAAAFADLVSEVELTDKLQSFMQWVPDGTLDLGLEHLTDAEIILPEPGDPYAMVNRHVELIRETADDRVILPVTGLHAFEALHQKIVEENATSELIVEPTIEETFRTNPSYVELYGEMVATGRFDIRVYDGDIPYYLGVLDDTVQIGVSEDGEPRAMLETENEAVGDWAAGVHAEYKRESEPLQVV